MRPTSAQIPGAIVEPLDARVLLAAVPGGPTAWEQYMLQLINRARSDPAAEAARLGIALNEGLPAGTLAATPRPPLVFSTALIAAARGHSQEMLDGDYFSLLSPDGSNYTARMAAAGYFFDPERAHGSAENIAFRGNSASVPPLTATTLQFHNDLFVDKDQPGRGHRLNMLIPEMREMGCGIVSGVYTQGAQDYQTLMATIDFAFNDDGRLFLTGAAFFDQLTVDQFYTPGEGLGGIAIQAVRSSDGAEFATTTWASGGYVLEVPPGEYTLTATGLGLEEPLVLTGVRVESANVQADFMRQAPVITPPVDATAPQVTVGPLPMVTKAGAKVYKFKVTFTDASRVKRASIDATAIQVTGPGKFKATAKLVAISAAADAESIVVTYSFTPPGGKWDYRDTGVYKLTLKARKVADTRGNTAPAATVLGKVTVAIPPPRK
jgi:hypothetical protein